MFFSFACKMLLPTHSTHTHSHTDTHTCVILFYNVGHCRQILTRMFTHSRPLFSPATIHTSTIHIVIYKTVRICVCVLIQNDLVLIMWIVCKEWNRFQISRCQRIRLWSTVVCVCYLLHSYFECVSLSISLCLSCCVCAFASCYLHFGEHFLLIAFYLRSSILFALVNRHTNYRYIHV